MNDNGSRLFSTLTPALSPRRGGAIIALDASLPFTAFESASSAASEVTLEINHRRAPSPGGEGRGEGGPKNILPTCT